MPWKAIACSATGTSHKKTGKPCQDYADFIRVNDFGGTDKNGDIVIGAVCDGAGSCKYSDQGSQLAVKTTLQFLQDWLVSLKQQGTDLSLAISDYAPKAFGENLAKVKEAFDAKAQEMSWPLRDLSCTLLAVVATPKWLAAMQIGDGFIVIRQPDSEYELLFQPSKGEYANQTTFVTARNALDTMQVKVVPGQQQFIFASTDGLERLALEIRQVSNPYPPFFDGFREAIETRSEDEEKISTQEWLQWEKVNKRTDDDKTILLCWYESGQIPQRIKPISERKPSSVDSDGNNYPKSKDNSSSEDDVTEDETENVTQSSPPNPESQPSVDSNCQSESGDKSSSESDVTEDESQPNPESQPSVDSNCESESKDNSSPESDVTEDEPKNVPEPNPETQPSADSNCESESGDKSSSESDVTGDEAENVTQPSPPNPESQPSVDSNCESESGDKSSSESDVTEDESPPNPESQPSVDSNCESESGDKSSSESDVTEDESPPNPESQPSVDSNCESESGDKSSSESDVTREKYLLTLNVLAGIFWTSIYHDVLIELPSKLTDVRKLVGIIIVTLITGLIFSANWQIYQQERKSSKPQWPEKQLFLYMGIIDVAGLGLGSLSYYLIH
jgi:hypothetical protein